MKNLPPPSEFDYTQLIKGWSPYIKPGWKPFPLQLAFCMLPHKEVLYGGSAGGGKSDALLAAALQYTHLSSYSAILFRKSYQDLIRPGALLDRAQSWLMPWLGKEIKYDRQSHIFYFPSGAKLAFGHMGRKGATDTMQGAEFHFCLEKTEKIRMGDGSLLPVSNVRVGDYVATLEGPKQVTKTTPPRSALCVEAKTPYGKQIQTTNHRFLTSFGWTSYEELSTQSHSSYNTVESSNTKDLKALLPSELKLSGLQPPYEHTYIHPYTKEIRSSYVGVQPLPCQLTPVGKKEVVDIRVADANHYISASHFVNMNCGIDEITQHSEADALYALSRLRRTATEDIPLRARFTANPGGIGHRWVFKRFGMAKNPNFDDNDPCSPMYIGTNPEKPFIPSRLADNPYLDIESYTKQLSELDPITRDRLLKGDWSAAPFGRFKPEWFIRYKQSAGYYISSAGAYQAGQMMRFATVDVAASYREGVGGRQFVTTSSNNDIANAEPCWTVIAVWGVVNRNLYLLDVFRMQTEIPEVFELMKRAQSKWGSLVFHVEKNGVGAGVAQGASRMGFNVEEVWTTNDKVINSYDASNLASQGRIIIPSRLPDDSAPPEHAWLDDWEGEVFSWMGLKDETSDQVDTMSTAAKKVAYLCLDKYAHPGAIKAPRPKVHGVYQWGMGAMSPH